MGLIEKSIVYGILADAYAKVADALAETSDKHNLTEEQELYNAEYKKAMTMSDEYVMKYNSLSEAHSMPDSSEW